jgi:Cu(I)/Ag(I) efflux system membrane fusion protein
MMMDDSSMMEGMGPGMMGMMGNSMMKMMMNDSGMMEGMGPGAMSAEIKDDHSAHQTMEMDTKEIKVKGEFKEQLQKAYDSYIEMKDAFVASDVKIVKNKADKLKSNLDEVDMGLLQGDAHMDWMEQVQKMNAAVLSIRDADDIEEQRSSFAEFNDNFYQSIKTFGLHHGTVYYQYCPMAFGEKGAYWLSNIKEIKNPYLGEAMLSCGETRETLEY